MNMYINYSIRILERTGLRVGGKSKVDKGACDITISLKVITLYLKNSQNATYLIKHAQENDSLFYIKI